MATSSSDPITRLVCELSKLPGIGEKTATRLAYHVLKTESSDIRALSDALLIAKEKVHLCSRCFTFTEHSLCSICDSFERSTSMICVVEKPSDVHSIEQSQKFKGLYHVLHGVLSPLDGIGPEQLKIKDLIARVQAESTKEIILALNPSVEGETTCAYLTKIFQPLGVLVTRIALGIPVGGVLEYIDKQTIGRAIEHRVESKS
ncbi:MAG: recombination mediator RecR [Bacteriovoracia bacterium]